MNITDQDHDEIVAIQIGTHVYFHQLAIDKVIEAGGFNNLHPRSTFKFMAEMDLDPKWAEYAKYPTIFDMKQYHAYARGVPIEEIFKSHPSGDDSITQR